MWEELFEEAHSRYSIMQEKNEIVPFLTYLSYKKPKSMIEIGCAKGGTTFLWTRILPPEGMKIIIDLPGGPWSLGGMNYLEVGALKTRLEGFSPNTHVRFSNSQHKDTLDWVKETLGEQKVDFLFIDGDHSYNGVKLDYENYKDFVAKDGIIAFHDIKSSPKHAELYCDVWRFWSEVKAKRKFTIEYPDDGHCGIGVIHKEE